MSPLLTPAFALFCSFVGDPVEAIAQNPEKIAPAMPLPAEPAPSPVAEPELPIDVGGYFFTRYEMRQGYDRLGVSAGRFLEGARLAGSNGSRALRRRCSLTFIRIR